VSEREKFHITADYYAFATGELEKEAQTYVLWMQSYPRDFIPHQNLGDNSRTLGQYDKAVAETQEALRLAPDNLTTHTNLGQDLLALNRLDDAKAAFDQARAHKLDGWALHLFTYYLAFLQGDSAQMEQQLSWGAGKPGAEDPLLSAQSDTDAYYGRLTKVQLLEAAAPYELGEPPPTQEGTLYPVYLRGQTYLLVREGQAAATEFQKFLDHRGVVLNFPLGALAHLQLGRSYALSGDTAKAKAAYQDFFTLWKDADPDIPILMQAKAEYAKLQ
jgi:tetratricopeptide (TPR) repeat protein